MFGALAVRLGLAGLNLSGLKAISLKMLFGMMLGGVLVLAFMYRGAESKRKELQTTVTSFTAAVAEVAGIAPDKLKPKDVVAQIKSIGQDRDIARRERASAEKVMKGQTDSIRAYEAETKRLRAVSTRNVELVAALVEQRNTWIARAKEAATRTDRLSCERELKETEETLDALYHAGF